MESKTLFQTWSKGYGVIQHQENTQAQVKTTIDKLASAGADTSQLIALFAAADRITNACMWLVVHQAYVRKIDLQGNSLSAEDFKEFPQGHVGGSLNMVPAYVGYMLANALSGITRSWIMGQGHCVAAIDSVNLILDNLLPEHAARYNLSAEGLTRFCTDFYSYQLNQQGLPDSPLGSHINSHTAGGSLEGGYLGFADLQYVHMPLPGENLIAFLSDGAFEEQRGADWAAHWWRAEDSGPAIPIMIFNGRRIDQRSMISQEQGLATFVQHLQNHDFDPMVFDGTDPAAFACMILQAEQLINERTKSPITYPIKLPYGIAVAKKGAGFYGEGTNAAHNLPLGANPHIDATARLHFNTSAQRLFVPLTDILPAKNALQNHTQTNRPKERLHPIANRDSHIEQFPKLNFAPLETTVSPMDGIDASFIAYVQANPHLRPRVGNPDEILSNHLKTTLNTLKHRVTEVEMPAAEAIDGKIITALNEEAVACACFGNKAGINLIVTYEAFGTKMLGAIRQELIWSDHLFAKQQEPGWISVPVVLTSHAYENGKNERSHQDPTLCEALLDEPDDISRVLFPADYNSACMALDSCYHSRGKIFTLVVPKNELPVVFDENQAAQLAKDGITRVISDNANESSSSTSIILTAIGAYQLQQVLRAQKRLSEHGITTYINYLLEPSRFRQPHNAREEQLHIHHALQEQYYPTSIPARVFVSHTHPEVMAGILRPLDSGKHTLFLGFINQGGTLDTEGMLFVNHQTWAHIVLAATECLGLDSSTLFYPNEIAALNGELNPQGIIIE